MRVLLTGANGFVGSHVFEALLARSVVTTLLLRPNADLRFISPLLDQTTVRRGTTDDPASLGQALDGVTHIVHCAGRTKAIHRAEYYLTNADGTRRLVEAAAARGSGLSRFVYISSLAASHPAGATRPAAEDDPSAPVSAYGASKLAGEQHLRQLASFDFAILRPSAVYGPRDREFLRLCKAVQAHLMPEFGGGRQPLSLVFVKDLAQAVVETLLHPGELRQTFNVAHPQPITAGMFVAETARQMGRWVLRLPLPRGALWTICYIQGLWARLTRRPSLLNREKYRELVAPGWVCDVKRLRAQLGFECSTDFPEGLSETLKWYREAAWL